MSHLLTLFYLTRHRLRNISYFIKREEKTLGIALNEFDTNELSAGTESRRAEG